MGKLTFCPYDGKKIEFNNLAYEIVFSEGWDFKRVKNDTVLRNKSRAYIVEHDTKRQESLPFVDRENHVMLLANSDKNGENGLTLLRDLIEQGEPEQMEKPAASYEDTMKHLYGMKFQLNGPSEKIEVDYPAVRTKLHYSYMQGKHTFLDQNEDPVMYALPCCPYCHNRLPVGWEEADDFIGVSLMGPKGAGKTSFLYACMHNKAENLAHSMMLAGAPVTIRPAHFEMDAKDSVYAYVCAQAARMCRENGRCPDGSAEQKALPVFLRVQYGTGEKKKLLIVGIYDDASQYLAQIDTIANGAFARLSDKMYADLYLFDPRDLQFQNIAAKKMSGQSRFKACTALSIEEQAKFQSEHAGQVISAQEILAIDEENAGEPKENRMMETIPTMQLYDRLVSMYRRYGAADVLERRRFLGVIAKNDLIREQVGEDYRALVTSVSVNSESEYGEIQRRSELTEDMLRSYGILGRQDLEKIRRDYGKGAGWHCISATGCDVVEHDHLLGAYAPIHVEDPIIACIVSRIKDMGWI